MYFQYSSYPKIRKFKHDQIDSVIISYKISKKSTNPRLLFKSRLLEKAKRG